MPVWKMDDPGICDFDEMGGDDQIGKAYSVRYTLPEPEDGLYALCTVGFYSQDHWGDHGDADARPLDRVPAEERFGIGQWIELLRCRDLEDPGCTEEFTQYAYRSSWFRRATPFTDEQIRSLMENFKPQEWIYWDGKDGPEPSMGWGSLVEGFATEDWDGLFLTPEIQCAIVDILRERAWIEESGQTSEAWLKALFEFDTCAECSGDWDKHTVVPDPLGLRHALCATPAAVLLDGTDNYGKPRQVFVDRVISLTDDQFVEETARIIWSASYAANNPNSDYHWQVVACHAEAERRGKPELYSTAYNESKNA